jgi:NADPH:quinone reductase-like Zn-dependent oxidoreductase
MPVAATFPFSQAAEAHRLSADGHVRGKLVLVPDSLADA